jgi:hypothetical protein
MPQKKSQIALEYMLVFSFVLIVFTLLFATIATQRIAVQSSQLFSEEQLIAMNISAQLDRALQAGSGYSASIPLSTAIGSVNYNLNITKNGAVVVSSLVGNQLVQAISYSSVKSVLSNSSFLAAGTSYYRIPTANGSLYIQNSFGTVCVDYACPAAGGQASALSLSSEVTHAAKFNGQTSYVSVSSTPVVTGNQVTMVIWADELGPGDAAPRGIIMAQAVAAPYIDTCYAGGSIFYVYTTNGPADEVGGTCPAYGVWRQYVGTYDGLTMKLYLNGVLVANALSQGGNLYATGPVVIGQYSGGSYNFNGLLANAQIYSTALSANQVQQLYQEGISGPPISGAGLAGWWPLNGNANDYSGYSNNGNVIGPLTYTTVAQLFAKATNQFGQAVTNTLVGFTTTLGNFTTSQVATNYTNSNGIATAFLNQQGNNGQALVKATVYNGNTALEGSLVGWWPLNLGQGSAAADLSGNGNNGAMSYTSWSQPNYVAKFDGKSSYIETQATENLGTSFSIGFWINPKLYNYGDPLSAGTTDKWLSFITFADGHMGYALGSGSAWGNGVTTSSGILTNNTWYYVVGTDNNGLIQLFINGISVGTASNNYPLNQVISIGARGSGVFYYFNGSISNVQIYNTAISANQVQQLYQEGISGPPITSNGLVGWWSLDGNAQDYSGNNNNGVIYGNLNFAGTSSIPSSNANATSMFTGNFNGASSYVNIPFSSALDSGNQYTVSAWIKTAYSGPVSQLIYSAWASGPHGYQLYVYGGTGYATIWSGKPLSIISNTIVNDGTWHNVMGVFSSSGTGYIYVDGVQVGSGAISNIANTGNSEIGEELSDSYFNGQIADVQVYNTAFSSSQAQQLYLGGMSGAPISGAGLVGWWPLNGNTNDYSGNGDNGTATNVIYSSQGVTSPRPLTSLNSYGANFNGQSSYISTGATGFPTGGSARSVFAWIYLTSAPTFYKGIVVYGTTSTCNAASALEWDPNFGSVYFDTLCGGLDSTFPVPLHTWTFVGYTYSNGVGTMYVNSNSNSHSPLYQGTPATVLPASDPSDIGKESNGMVGDFFPGYIADVQIYNTALSANQVQQLYQSQMPPSMSASVPLGWEP